MNMIKQRPNTNTKTGGSASGAATKPCNNEQPRRQGCQFQIKLGVLLMVGFYFSHMFLGGTPENNRLQEERTVIPDNNNNNNNNKVSNGGGEANTRGGGGASRRTQAQNKKQLPLLPPIHGQTLQVIAPNHPTWTDDAVHEEFQNALTKIQNAPILHEPFDHFFVKDLFSAKFYQALMEELPPPSMYKKIRYPGTDPMYKALHVASSIPKNRNDTHVHIPDSCFMNKSEKHDKKDLIAKRKQAGCWLEEVQLHDKKARTGLTLTVDQDASKYPLWVQAFRFVHSRNFTHLMYSKFATSTGIPQYKQQEVLRQGHNGTVANLRNTAALRIEPTSYHLTPHVDRYEKLVTWQFFHPESMELENRTVGTQFYEIKPEFQGTFEIQDDKNPNWLDYSHFNSIKEQPVIPNYFFSFAPNNHSWHGAAIDPDKLKGVNKFARRTFLGFITTSYWGFHHFNKGDWAPEEFDLTKPMATATE